MSESAFTQAANTDAHNSATARAISSKIEPTVRLIQLLDPRPPYINVPFVLFRAVGAARGAEMRPIENREGRGTLAFDGCHLNNKFKNQPKVGSIG